MPLSNNVMTENELKAFAELLMVSDPWPINHGQDLISDFVDEAARAHGYDDWIDAYHRIEPLIENHAFSGSV